MDWSNPNGGQGGGDGGARNAGGFQAFLTVFQNGVQQLAAIAKALSAQAALSAKPTTVLGNAATGDVIGYIEVTLADGSVVLVPYYAKG